jgi:hypothetical protein
MGEEGAMSHTPGPWRWDEQAEGHASALVIRSDATHYRVAEVCGPITDEPRPPGHAPNSVRANARLIALAPEMYALILDYWGTSDLAQGPMAERARAILATLEATQP